MPPRRVSAAAVVFALLVLATIAAFAWSQRLKRDPLVIDRVSLDSGVGRQFVPRQAFTPNGDCRLDRARIRFRATRSDTGDVQVIKPGGELVITLARNVYLHRYRFFTYHWDGRTRGDGIAPPGRYKLRIKLLGQERTLVPPGVIKLHHAPRNPAPGCHRAAPLSGGSAT